MNIKNNIKIALATLIAMPLAIACDDDETSPIIPADPVFVKATPESGSYVSASDADTIRVKYDKMIFFSSAKANSIAISAGSITSAQVLGADSVLTIVANMKQKGTTYTITIPDGLVLGSNGTSAAGVTLTYQTKAALAMSETPVQATSATAKALYTYLTEQYGKKTLSGMMANVAWNNTESEKVNTLTGKYPAINCYDYIHIPASVSGANWIDYSDITPAKEWSNAGGIVAAGWHWMVPKETIELSNKTLKADGDVTLSDEVTVIENWNASVQIAADKFADAEVGQYINVAVKGLASDAQGSFKTASDGWPAIAEGTEYFTIKGNFYLKITDDILTQLKATGLIVSGQNYTIVSVTLSSEAIEETITSDETDSEIATAVASLDVNSGFTYTPSETTFSLKNAVTEGTWEYEYVQYDLANISQYLLKLREANIPVLWRPLHEASGGWFWWGTDAESYKKLWIMMFNYFKAEGLDNLIWVWTSQIGDDTWYPGDNYVDIVGCDIYGTSPDPAQSYATLADTYSNKIVTLSECGYSTYTSSRIANISEQFAAGAKWSWFMPWYDADSAENKHADDAWWTDAMNCENVITRDQLPSFK